MTTTEPLGPCGSRQRTHAETVERPGRGMAGLAGLGMGPGRRVTAVLRYDPACPQGSTTAWYCLPAGSGDRVMFAHGDVPGEVEPAPPPGVAVGTAPAPADTAAAHAVPTDAAALTGLAV
jgi:hypothetical protein